ncbi:hypothetical protein Tco_1489834, partial [Tanacetum coccineum]
LFWSLGYSLAEKVAYNAVRATHSLIKALSNKYGDKRRSLRRLCYYYLCSPRVGQALLEQLMTSREHTNFLLSAEDRGQKQRGRVYDRGRMKQKHVEIMEDRRDKVQAKYHVLELQPECSKLVASRVKEVNMAARDSDDALALGMLSSKLPLVQVGLSRMLGSLVVARGNKRGSLYMVEVHPEGIGAIIEGSALFSTRLGDIGRIGMNMLASKGNVPSAWNVDIYFCKPDGLGKQKKVSFKMSEKTRKLQRLELVHTEGYGLTFIASI